MSTPIDGRGDTAADSILRASDLTLETFAVQVPSSLGSLVQESVQDADGKEKQEWYFRPSDRSKAMLFDVNASTGALRHFSALARYLGDRGILPPVASGHAGLSDYQSSDWWLAYAEKHGVKWSELAAAGKALSEAAVAYRATKQAELEAILG